MLDNDLYLLNDGYEFTVDDLESLSRSAYSNKSRGTTIGYRGIGFKSVAGICQSVSLMSGNLEVCFSREKTEDLFGLVGYKFLKTNKIYVPLTTETEITINEQLLLTAKHMKIERQSPIELQKYN